MKKLLGLIFVSLILNSNVYAIPQDGKGELKLSNNVITHFQNYLRGGVSEGAKSLNNKPMVFYVTSDGANSYFWYCSHGQCMSGSPKREKLLCEEVYDKECFRFARKTSIRWKNGINPGKGKQSKFDARMTDSEILAKLTELGFYGNEISSTVKPKITKKKVESKKPTDADKGNIISQIKDLKELLDNGVITQDEFDRAKKKILN
jgi:hypothetical protein